MSMPRDALARGTQRLAAAGIPSARLDARVLLEHALNHPPLEGGSKNQQDFSGRGPAPTPSHHLSPKSAAQISALPQGEGGLDLFEQFIQRRIAREPVAYITGTKEFWSLSFDVGPGVLVPRPETETLIEEVLREFPDRAAPLRAVDFGTGSGAILIAFLSEFRNARGLGIDDSPRALVWAERNLAKHGLGGRCELTLADWSASPENSSDVILANPPYLTRAEVEAASPELGHEPPGALDGGRDGLDAYRALAPMIAHRLRPQGRAFLEIGLGQGDAVAALLASQGLETMRIAPDLAGIPRCVVVRPQKTVGKSRASL